MVSQQTDSPRSSLTQWMTPALVAAGIALLAAAATHRAKIELTEAAGFVTGGLTVWLLVRQNIWNWPIGIANNLIFGVLFYNQRLYADMTLQLFFLLLSIYGWISWLRGKTGEGGLRVTRTPLQTAIVCAGIGIVATWAATLYLTRINDSAPFLDALTTVMSLIAQYLMTRKYLENWTIWIVVDIISIGLYSSKHLYLTSVLFAIYIAMCTVGAIEWRRAFVRATHA